MEAAEPAAYGTLPEPYPPTELLVIEVKQQIRDHMEHFDPFAVRKRHKAPPAQVCQRPGRGPAAPMAHARKSGRSTGMRVSLAAAKRGKQSKRSMRGISFASDVTGTRQELGDAGDSVVRFMRPLMSRLTERLSICIAATELNT
jgi:hypothetical protein